MSQIQVIFSRRLCVKEDCLTLKYKEWDHLAQLGKDPTRSQELYNLEIIDLKTYMKESFSPMECQTFEKVLSIGVSIFFLKKSTTTFRIQFLALLTSIKKDESEKIPKTMSVNYKNNED